MKYKQVNTETEAQAHARSQAQARAEAEAQCECDGQTDPEREVTLKRPHHPSKTSAWRLSMNRVQAAGGITSAGASAVAVYPAQRC